MTDSMERTERLKQCIAEMAYDSIRRKNAHRHEMRTPLMTM